MISTKPDCRLQAPCSAAPGAFAPRNHNRRLAVVGVFDARPGYVQHKDDRLVAARTLLGQDGVEAFAVGSQRAERVADRNRPVKAGDDTPLVDTVRAPGERGLDHVRDKGMTIGL